MLDVIFIFKKLDFLQTWERGLLIFLFLFTMTAKSSVLSLDVCADQLLAEFLEPSDFCGASYLSRDSTVSSYSDFFKAVPIHYGRVENFIGMPVKTVVVMETIDPFLKDYFLRKGVQIIILKNPSSLNDLKQLWQKLGEIFNKKSRARELCQQLDDVLKNSSPTQQSYIFYGSQGISMGANTLWTDLLSAWNYKNEFATQKGWFYKGFEDIAANKAPLVILLGISKREMSHPFFQKLARHKKIISLLPTITLCPCFKNICAMGLSLRCSGLLPQSSYRNSPQ